MIVATAGHVDHGKTALIRHLTGVDTDRLEEEKRRGLSIDLGFAYSREAGHPSIGFIDVPGHNRFINTMIAGVSGIDLGMLVVAADDGPMPQTFEHLDIMRTLGVSDYVAVVTKIDRVEQGRVGEVSDSVKSLFADSCPVFAVNAVDGNGVAKLKRFLVGRAEQLEPRPDAGYFRMSIDRSFVLKGTGLVVTGTAISGKVSRGDSVMLLPQGKPLRVRSIHVQNQAAETCKAGQRCALGVVGDITRTAINRGDSLLDPRLATATTRFDASVDLLPGAPFGLKHLSPVKLYIGAARKRAKLFLLQKPGRPNVLGPGEHCLAQLLVDGELACCCGDRFLLRDDSESVTLGGGIILDPHAPRTGKANLSRLNYLAAMQAGTVGATLKALLIHHRQVLDLGRFRQSLNLRGRELNRALRESGLAEKISHFEAEGTEYAVATQKWDAAGRDIHAKLSDWHRENPEQAGIILKELKAGLATRIEPLLFEASVAALQKGGAIRISNGLVSASSHRAADSVDAGGPWALVEQALSKHGKRIPTLADLQQDIAVDEKFVFSALQAALRSGKVIRLAERRFALPSVLRELAESVNELASETPRFSIVDFKNHTGLGRNLTVELLEYFDSVRFTRRVGDRRLVINAELPGRFFGSM